MLQRRIGPRRMEKHVGHYDYLGRSPVIEAPPCSRKVALRRMVDPEHSRVEFEQ